jgi:hypothetical protein
MPQGRFIRGLLLCFCGVISNGQSGGRKDATLTVRIVSRFGGAMPGGRLSIRSRNGVFAYEAGVKSEISVSLPYGEYLVSFRGDFLAPVERGVTVDRPECFTVLATDMDRVVLDVKHDSVSISVRVQPATSCAGGGLLWAKLAGVFSDDSSERRIGSAGFALFDPVEAGTYVLVIVDGPEVRAAQVVVTSGPTTVANVALAPCKIAK